MKKKKEPWLPYFDGRMTARLLSIPFITLFLGVIIKEPMILIVGGALFGVFMFVRAFKSKR